LEETTDYEIDDTNASINNSVEQLTNLSCQGSIASISSSIDDNELNETQDAPIEVAETRSSGKVSRSIYSLYISSGGNAFSLLFLLFISLFTQMLGTGGDYWLIYWYIDLDFDFIYCLTLCNAKNNKCILGLI